MKAGRQYSDTWHILGRCSGLGFLFGSRAGSVSGIASLHSAWGAGPESMLGVNYHLGREDVRISAAHVGTPHRQHGFDFGSNLDLLADLLPSISTLDSGSDMIDSRHSFSLVRLHHGEQCGSRIPSLVGPASELYPSNGDLGRVP